MDLLLTIYFHAWSEQVVAHPDFLAVFGENAPSERHQCAEVSRSQFRRRVRLLGTRHDVQVRFAMMHCRGSPV